MSENRTTEIHRRQGPGVQNVFLYGDIMIDELEMVQDSELELQRKVHFAYDKKLFLRMRKKYYSKHTQRSKSCKKYMIFGNYILFSKFQVIVE